MSSSLRSRRWTPDSAAKVLWNLYRRGTAAVRERIEGELDPRERERRKKAAPPDPDLVLMEVRDFVNWPSRVPTSPNWTGSRPRMLRRR